MAIDATSARILGLVTDWGGWSLNVPTPGHYPCRFTSCRSLSGRGSVTGHREQEDLEGNPNAEVKAVAASPWFRLPHATTLRSRGSMG